MPIPLPRIGRHHAAEPYVEEATFYSAELDPSGEPRRTYHVRRIDTGGGWSYVVTMEVIAKRAWEDIMGEAAPEGGNTRRLFERIWPTAAPHATAS
jgi:hypothetical protein